MHNTDKQINVSGVLPFASSLTFDSLSSSEKIYAQTGDISSIIVLVYILVEGTSMGS